jgi:murein DD-endopeptidase MepM/ murein hydrolase activator NlpD
MAEIKKAANKAAAKLARAQADVAKLNDQITKVARQVDTLKAEILPLREAVTRRTTAVYKAGRGMGVVAGLSDQRNPVKSALGVKMVSGANKADGKIIARLNTAMAELDRRTAELVAKRSLQETALTRLEGERQTLESQLAAMERAGRELQARLQKAKTAANRSSRSRRRVLGAVPPAVPPVGPSSIPVVTNFICPIVGPFAFTDSWGNPRSGGRRHQGTDIMSPRGTVNVAVVSGSFERHHSGAGGLAVYLYGDDGHTYYYAHLDEVAGPDRRVAQGEEIGKTGSSGNARGGSPHTHFEFHPNGGKAVSSYPMLKAACG